VSEQGACYVCGRESVSVHLAFGGSHKGKLTCTPCYMGGVDTSDVGMGFVADLLEEVRAFVSRFVVLPSDEARDLVALWVLHTHAFEAAWATPYLRIVSATPDSGKTLLMEILAEICRNGWHAVNPSVAVLYRMVDKRQPTLLLDEMDNYPLDERRDAVSVLNAGYKRGATVPRCNERGDLNEFSVFCPKAYAGLDTRSIVPALLSRSITLRMEKKTADEHVEPWIAPLVADEAASLRERCELWAERHVEALTGHHPDLLGLTNRAAEVWWALLSIAEHAGRDWPARARGAVRALASGGDDTDERPEQVQLLLDIRDAFDGHETIFTKVLLAKLNALDESPWGARRRGEGLDARGLSRMLRPFKIKPRPVRLGNEVARGYHHEQFEDAFARHLPEALHALHALHPAPGLERDVTDVTGVTDIAAPGPGSDDPSQASQALHRSPDAERDATDVSDKPSPPTDGADGAATSEEAGDWICTECGQRLIRDLDGLYQCPKHGGDITDEYLAEVRAEELVEEAQDEDAAKALEAVEALDDGEPLWKSAPSRPLREGE
jgi:hypothetical protein